MTVPAPAMDVMARMASIQNRFAWLNGAGSGADTGVTSVDGASMLGSTDVPASTGVDFASVMADVQSPRLGSSSALRSTSLNGAATGSGAGATAVLDAAKEYLGIPYLWGGTDPKVGLDCSGFTQNVFRGFGIELPRVSRDQARMGTEVPSMDQAKPGDLIAFGQPVDHIAIYMGDGKIIHAPRTGDVVKISDIYRKPTAIRRVIPESPLPMPSQPLLGQASGSPKVSPVGAGGAVNPVWSAEGGSGLLDKLGQFRTFFEQSGAKYGLSPNLLAAVADVESGGNPNVTSSAGAKGLMQFMPATAKAMGIDPLDPQQAIDGAGRYISDQLRSFGSLELALAAYNAGPGAVRRYGGVPPYAETQSYVRKIAQRLGGSL